MTLPRYLRKLPARKRSRARVVRPDARRNAISRKVTVRHATDSRLLRYANLDRRSAAGKLYWKAKAELEAHIGRERCGRRHQGRRWLQDIGPVLLPTGSAKRLG